MIREQARGSGERFRALDLARGLAVIAMLASHATDAFLADAWRGNDAWYGVNILFGFVAPAFTFLSGVTLFHSLERGADPPGAPWRKTIRSLVRLLLLGYWLQIPILSLRQLIWNQRPDELARLFDANILQTIAIAGMTTLLLLRLSRSPDRARWLSLSLGVVVVIATPFIRDSGLWRDLPLFMNRYCAPQPPATFPLFPYAAYLFFGYAAARPLAAAFGSRRGGWWLLAIGAAIVGAGLAADPLLHRFPPFADFWGSSPQHVVFRLGGIAILVGASTMATFMPALGKLEPLLHAGRKSLAVYILHLMLIYGSPVSKGMRLWYNGALARTLSPVETLGMMAAVLLLCYGAIRAWETLRERSPSVARWGKIIWWSAFWGLFLLIP